MDTDSDDDSYASDINSSVSENSDDRGESLRKKVMQIEDLDDADIRSTFDVVGVGAGSRKKLSQIVLQKKRLLQGLGSRLSRMDDDDDSDSDDKDDDDASDNSNWSDDLDIVGENGVVRRGGTAQ